MVWPQSKRAPEHSVAGIILACVSLVVMPFLSRAKRKVGRALGSAAMHADAKQTEFCTYLSGILLAGLLLNAVVGLWWADSVAALIMVPIIAKEGIEGLQGKACDECRASARGTDPGEDRNRGGDGSSARGTGGKVSARSDRLLSLSAAQGASPSSQDTVNARARFGSSQPQHSWRLEVRS